MGRQKGQGIVEYALILAFVVGIGGVLFANGNLADSIRSVFSNVNTLIEEASKPPLAAATTAKDIIERLRQGRYEGLAADELPGKLSKTLEITSDSPEGQQLAKKLNIQTKQGDAWFARVYTNGVTVFTYYSADANKGKTYQDLRGIETGLQCQSQQVLHKGDGEEAYHGLDYGRILQQQWWQRRKHGSHLL